MLSNTKGTQRCSRALGGRSDELSKLGKLCHVWRDTGKCKAYSRELEVRHQIAAAKEAELLKKATALYTMQAELMADMAEEDGAEATALLSTAVQHTDPAAATQVIERLVEELKQEPAYLNWSLDAAVAERMVELHVRPCPFAHRGDVTVTLKRHRSEQAKEEAHRQQQHGLEEAALLAGRRPGSTGAVAAEDTDAEDADAEDADDGAAERCRLFHALTQLQKCVVCLLWQRHIRVAQGLVMDVRLALEKRATVLYEATGTVVAPSLQAADDAPQQQQHQQHQQPASHPRSSSSGTGQEDGADGADALDSYLSSAAFEALVEEEAARVVTRVTFRPELGLVDLSALPRLVAHLSANPTCGLVHARTLAFFTGTTVARRCRDAPVSAKASRHLSPQGRGLTAKEVDLSTAARADEVVEAVEWVLRLCDDEAQRCAASTELESRAVDPVSPHVTSLFRNQRTRLHGLTLAHCQITSADALVESLHKRHMETYLYALDLSHNRLWSLRFLLVLRAHYAHRLLRLSLRSNPITRKPEYQEQVRTALPHLTSLDGAPIRRPPLRLPKPWPTSCTRWSTEEGTSAHAEQALVLDCVARLLYIWEHRRIPHTARELAAFADAGRAAPEEEELNDDNFSHRYLHPAAAFTVTVSPHLSFFDAATMRDTRSVELDDAYTGMRLSAVDVRDARVFDVAMKNGSRNLLAGRPALQRFGRGATNCYLAYQLTLYPERMAVSHHTTGAVVSAAVVADGAGGGVSAGAGKATTAASGTGTASAPRFGALAHRTAPSALHIVTLHGIMTWRLPSMKRTECLQAAYTRVMTLMKAVLPAQNRDWERLRSPPYVLVNDHVFLYPAPLTTTTTTTTTATTAVALLPPVFSANTPTRLSRLVVEFGLEACRDGVVLVRDVMERCTSPAAEYAALQALVLGVLDPRRDDNDNDSKDDEDGDGEAQAQRACAMAAESQLTPLLADYISHAPSQPPPHASQPSREYVIFSVLDATAATTALPTADATAATTTSSTAATPSRRKSSPAAVATPPQQQQQQQQQPADVLAWAGAPHVVSVSLLHGVTAITNRCYTIHLK
ncbi:hypothetical protein NESM_000067200 [Novymonas esmeraldas]|uniref:Uncharacterized protein n=1 Tax=Novymonas esmeraldas TaxID=1808958 RepID=A0AAW0F4H9_9TRYP